mgnify:FL=1
MFKKNNDGKYAVYTKQYLKVDNTNKQIDRKQPPMSVIDNFSNIQGSKELKKLELPEYFERSHENKVL